ncbi:MAG: HEAT repeat domain-containing protein, partial [Solibacillus sp.]
NAILALAHFKEEAAMPDLIQVLQKDERPVLRGTAAWAIGKIGTEGAEDILLAARNTEQDEEVLAEIEKGLAMLNH